MNEERKTIELTVGLYGIVSEPGDGTRYSYYVKRKGDTFSFMPNDNTFRYPQTLGFWDVKDIDEVTQCHGIADEWSCNPWTVMECINTIKAIMKEN